MMKTRYYLLSLLLILISLSSCGDKKPKEPVAVTPPKQEVVKPDTVAVVEEPVVEEIIEEVAPQQRMINVQQGEWLCDIARREYGSLAGWKKIYEANKEKIDNPDLIYPNQELIIPE